jgi:hypothetical protein
MTATGNSPTHIELAFKQNAAEITCRFVVSPEILRQAQIWYAKNQLTEAASLPALDIACWFASHGARLDRADGPARVEIRSDGSRIEEWFRDGKRHRSIGPARIYEHSAGNLVESWYRDDELHREDGPAVIERRPDGTHAEFWYRDGQQHRDDGPAYVLTDKHGVCTESYFLEDTLIKTVTLAPLKALPGVKILDAPQPGPAP